MAVVSVLGIALLAAIVLFCTPFRNRAERALFGNADAKSGASREQEQPHPLTEARDTVEGIWQQAAEAARARYGDPADEPPSGG
jgi:hypothetical protein